MPQQRKSRNVTRVWAVGQSRDVLRDGFYREQDFDRQMTGLQRAPDESRCNSGCSGGRTPRGRKIARR